MYAHGDVAAASANPDRTAVKLMALHAGMTDLAEFVDLVGGETFGGGDSTWMRSVTMTYSGQRSVTTTYRWGHSAWLLVASIRCCWLGTQLGADTTALTLSIRSRCRDLAPRSVCNKGLVAVLPSETRVELQEVWSRWRLAPDRPIKNQSDGHEDGGHSPRNRSVEGKRFPIGKDFVV
jgi:hypothetical protein